MICTCKSLNENLFWILTGPNKLNWIKYWIFTSKGHQCSKMPPILKVWIFKLIQIWESLWFCVSKGDGFSLGTLVFSTISKLAISIAMKKTWFGHKTTLLHSEKFKEVSSNYQYDFALNRKKYIAIFFHIIVNTCV